MELDFLRIQSKIQNVFCLEHQEYAKAEIVDGQLSISACCESLHQAAFNAIEKDIEELANSQIEKRFGSSGMI